MKIICALNDFRLRTFWIFSCMLLRTKINLHIWNQRSSENSRNASQPNRWSQNTEDEAAYSVQNNKHCHQVTILDEKVNFVSVELRYHFSVDYRHTAPSPLRSTDHQICPPADGHCVENPKLCINAKKFKVKGCQLSRVVPSCNINFS